MSPRAWPLYPPYAPGSSHSPGRRAKANPDFILVSHGPDHCILMPRSARADRWLDLNADPGEDAWCDTGWKIPWIKLRDTLATVRAAGFAVEE